MARHTGMAVCLAWLALPLLAHAAPGAPSACWKGPLQLAPARPATVEVEGTASALVKQNGAGRARIEAEFLARCDALEKVLVAREVAAPASPKGHSRCYGLHKLYGDHAVAVRLNTVQKDGTVTVHGVYAVSAGALGDAGKALRFATRNTVAVLLLERTANADGYALVSDQGALAQLMFEEEAAALGATLVPLSLSKEQQEQLRQTGNLRQLDLACLAAAAGATYVFHGYVTWADKGPVFAPGWRHYTYDLVFTARRANSPLAVRYERSGSAPCVSAERKPVRCQEVFYNNGIRPAVHDLLARLYENQTR